MSSKLPDFYDFGAFRLSPRERLLLREGIVIALTPKAFETLLLLVRNSGRMVGKEEMLQSIWADTFVEEAIVAQNIFILRKVLGGRADQYIQTIPKRGYRFAASVMEVNAPSASLQEEQLRTERDVAGPGKTETQDGRITSLAILPMINESTDPNAEYLTTSITESLVNSLSLLPDLHVKACSTVMRYEGRRVDPQEAGLELGVAWVLIGGVSLVGENIMIKVELVDVANGWQLWGKQYDDKISDILRIHENISRNICERLRLKLKGSDPRLLFKLGTESAEAYQLYLKGRYMLNTRTREGYEKAMKAFEQAIEIDPDYSLAYTGLGDSCIQFDFYGLVPPLETIQKARAAVSKALEIDDGLAEAHNTLASIKLVYDRDRAGAEREFRLAIELDPKLAWAHSGYAHCLLEMSLPEAALAECKLALELEPADPEINQQLAWHYLLARQFPQAIEQLDKTLELSPDFYRARLLLGIAYGQKGSFAEAIREFKRANQIEDTPVLSGFLGYAYGMSGNKKEALALLDAMLRKSKRTYVPPYSIALVFAGLNQLEPALQWLEKACVENGRWRGWLMLTPEFDGLVSQERFADLLRSASIPEK